MVVGGGGGTVVGLHCGTSIGRRKRAKEEGAGGQGEKRNNDMWVVDRFKDGRSFAVCLHLAVVVFVDAEKARRGNEETALIVLKSTMTSGRPVSADWVNQLSSCLLNSLHHQKYMQ